jgi:hypothetical protein
MEKRRMGNRGVNERIFDKNYVFFFPEEIKSNGEVSGRFLSIPKEKIKCMQLTTVKQTNGVKRISK